MEAREARRRKIVERGTDRLALITGRIQNLPQPSSPSSAPLNSTPRLDHEIQPAFTSKDDGVSSSQLPKCDSPGEFPVHNVIGGESRKEPRLNDRAASVEGTGSPASSFEGNGQSSITSATEWSSANFRNRGAQHAEPVINKLKTAFTPNKISSAIATLQSTRILCSVIVALLVVLSHLGFPLLGSNFVKNAVLSRPLHLVLLTNLTILVSRLLQGKQRAFDTNKVPSDQEYGLAEKLGKAFEILMLLQNALTAWFMDCSIYSVIVICGLSWCSN